jgi:hypothetical protein
MTRPNLTATMTMRGIASDARLTRTTGSVLQVQSSVHVRQPLLVLLSLLL